MIHQTSRVIEFRFPFSSLPFTDSAGKEWKRLAGGRHGRRLKRLLHNEGDENHSLSDHLVRPRLSFTTTAIETVSAGSVTMEQGVVLESEKLAGTLAGCRWALCFVATIGPEIDRKIKALSRGNRCADEYLLDRVGSLAIEEFVNAFHLEMEQRFTGENKGVTMRFSPGYCDWPLDDQRKLFTLVDTEYIGVSLTESLLMMPRKSVSGIFGIAETEGGRLPPIHNPCLHCRERRCPERRPTPSRPSFQKHRFHFYRVGSNGGDDS
ncbi:MAG: hypothetical protein M0Q23_00115 [Syntrophales bacterium]|jgi:hypothetical protein|nr:hypothetical protein [Syntrophales bacterium]MCK9527053.1 hypothetical protein [Syntrophales bacterium]MDX9921822.1 vitamin B12 dependent-methionine synthase activation domain-containing protein [Syntrophales bacterium]